MPHVHPTHSHPTKSEIAAEKAEKASAAIEATNAKNEAAAAAKAEVVVPVAPKANVFPSRTADFPKGPPRPSITVNGNVKTEKDGVKSEMTAGEIAALDRIPADKFVRLDYHNSITKDGKSTLTEVTQALAITDGMEFVAVSR